MENLVCIRCPIGCRISAEKTDEGLKITGNTCKRGEDYAREELTCPKRILTCALRVEGADEPLSVKTKDGVPKAMIFDCVREIKSLHLAAPVAAGTVVIENLCKTGVCVIATKSV